jgi:Fur family ferric uptake transcriptional regulator
MGRSTGQLENAQVADLLREAGLRATAGRRKIVQGLSTLGHATPEELFDHVVLTFPGLNLSTVYRTLETLTSVGLAYHAHLAGSSRTCYLASGDDHAHLVCDTCGQVTELSGSLLRRFTSGVTQTHGFEVRPHHVSVHGRCAPCRELVGFAALGPESC